MIPKLITAKALSALISVPEETLSKWRQYKVGPPYFRLTNGRVRYDPIAVRAWLDSIEVQPA